MSAEESDDGSELNSIERQGQSGGARARRAKLESPFRGMNGNEHYPRETDNPHAISTGASIINTVDNESHEGSEPSV